MALSICSANNDLFFTLLCLHRFYVIAYDGNYASSMYD